MIGFFLCFYAKSMNVFHVYHTLESVDVLYNEPQYLQYPLVPRVLVSVTRCQYMMRSCRRTLNDHLKKMKTKRFTVGDNSCMLYGLAI